MISTVQYSTVQYSTVQYSTVQFSTVQYSNDSPGEQETHSRNIPQLTSLTQYSTVQYSTENWWPQMSRNMGKSRNSEKQVMSQVGKILAISRKE